MEKEAVNIIMKDCPNISSAAYNYISEKFIEVLKNQNKIIAGKSELIQQYMSGKVLQNG